jgi:hypothetical protein
LKSVTFGGESVTAHRHLGSRLPLRYLHLHPSKFPKHRSSCDIYVVIKNEALTRAQLADLYAVGEFRSGDHGSLA